MFTDTPAYGTATDVDGVVVQSQLITKAYAPRSVTQLKRFRSVLLTMIRSQSSGGSLDTTMWGLPGIGVVDPNVVPSSSYRNKSFGYGTSGSLEGLQTFRMDMSSSTVPNPTTQGLSVVVRTTGASGFELSGVGLSYNLLRDRRTTG